ncbi:hypothetical protein B0O99DRAFT_695115 [Bisporella sp. PMI_857]|nr:hypothetical protein B0O99DRAFT_695115 [Bisporella sp. PMI_857]
MSLRASLLIFASLLSLTQSVGISPENQIYGGSGDDEKTAVVGTQLRFVNNVIDEVVNSNKTVSIALTNNPDFKTTGETKETLISWLFTDIPGSSERNWTVTLDPFTNAPQAPKEWPSQSINPANSSLKSLDPNTNGTIKYGFIFFYGPDSITRSGEWTIRTADSASPVPSSTPSNTNAATPSPTNAGGAAPSQTTEGGNGAAGMSVHSGVRFAGAVAVLSVVLMV